ncbi:PREDICTED: lachesin-like, partial [Rhagoletis zephyria]|uniref:lachesin-like n=1 Tax=Rhagoletis zephyria TaxID=28612 RepID=UPI0008114FB1
RNPSISFISKDKVVNIGDQLELKCQVQDAGNYPVQWSKLGSPQVTLSTSQTIVTPSTRHHIRYDDRDSTYTLLIDKVQEIDAGTYRCEISIGASNYHLKSSFTADTPVIVRIQPVISDNSTRSVITTAGSRVDLQCYGAGYPQPIISWRREKHRLLPNNMAFFKGNTLTIGNVSKDDRGTYYCVADNGVGSGARRHIGVEVEFAPYVWSIQPKVEQAM